MKTIQEIFAENLRRLRGDRSQAVIAEKIGIHSVSYQRYENGTIPQGPNMEALVKGLGIEESELFVDHSAYVPRSAIEIQDGLAALFEKFPKLDHAGRTRVLNVLAEQFEKIQPKSKSEISSKG